ncbi:pentapeptide repeat-containing protein [Maridesulfovibrio sp.]|uniref:pentapeptide repeat-containing protein n=1 Tax=Maridesulfovibrio sp. TaxID=2795000 RepID=UPI002A1889C1|nr:pentapeptide repeat-containing protein [Maridesulfovibrio sp.]
MEFKGPTHLDGAFFLDKTTFTNAIFHEYSNFEKTRFYGPVSFRHALFKEWTYFRNVKFLAPTSFAGTISKETILVEAADLSLLSLSETNIESFQFTECTWPKGKNGHRIIRDETVKLECKEKRKPAELEKIYRQLEEIYRRLKKVARENNDEMRASTWHYKEKEMLRKRLREENGPGIIENIYAKVCDYLPCGIEDFQQKTAGLVAAAEKKSTPFIRFLNTAYWLVSGYGEEPLRAGAWLLVFIFGAMVAAFFGPDAAQATQTSATAQLPEVSGGFIKSWLWYMPLLKIDKLQPTGWNELFRALFNVAISVQAALFGFALRNKLRR